MTIASGTISIETNCDVENMPTVPRDVAAVELDDEPRDAVEQHVAPERPARERPSFPLGREQEQEDEQLGAGLVELRRVQRHASSGVPTFCAANSLRNVIAHGTSVGRPKQQPANRQPRRPMTWPSAMPGANTSVTVHIGIRCRHRYHSATTTAAISPP